VRGIRKVGEGRGEVGKGGKGRGWKEGVREGESGMRGPQAGRCLAMHLFRCKRVNCRKYKAERQ